MREGINEGTIYKVMSRKHSIIGLMVEEPLTPQPKG